MYFHLAVNTVLGGGVSLLHQCHLYLNEYIHLPLSEFIFGAYLEQEWTGVKIRFHNLAAYKPDPAHRHALVGSYCVFKIF